MSAHGFIPHPECNVASGECFTKSRCLGQCKARQKQRQDVQISELRRRVEALELRLSGQQKGE